MKKLLSFALALFMGISLFAQDAYYSSLANGSLPSDWVMSQNWASQNYADWLFDGDYGYAYSECMAGYYADGTTDGSNGMFNFLMSPTFMLSNAHVNGSVEFWAAAGSFSNDESVAYFSVMAVDRTTQKLYSTSTEELSSEEGGFWISYSFDEFYDDDENPLTLVATEHEICFAICHIGNDNADGFLAVSDFVLRKRDDAFIQIFFPGEGTGDAFYLVTEEGGSFTLPAANVFTAPTGKVFAAWGTTDGENEYYADAESEATDVDQDFYWYALFDDEQGGEGEGGQGGQGGGQGEGGQGGQGGEGEGGQGGGTAGISSADINSVSLYPNPAQNMVRVNGVTASRLDLMDLTGRTVRSIEGGNTIDLSGLNNGVYMLRITAGESTAVRKVVKK